MCSQVLHPPLFASLTKSLLSLWKAARQVEIDDVSPVQWCMLGTSTVSVIAIKT